MKPIHTTPHILIASLSWLLLALLTAGCGGSPNDQSTSPGKESKGPKVQTTRPKQQTLHRLIERPAYAEAIEETALFARIPGLVSKYVDIGYKMKGPRQEGKDVSEGEVLAELWVPERVEELKRKRAHVVQAKAQVEQAQEALKAAEANEATTRALIKEAEAARIRAKANYERWRLEYLRIQKMVKDSALEKQVLDETRNQLLAAEAAQQEVEAKIQSTKAMADESKAKRGKAAADVLAAQAHVQVAQAEADSAAVWLAYSKIRAPYDGIVIRRNIFTNSYVTASATEPLYVVARTDTLRVFADVPEADATLIRKGTPVRIAFQVVRNQKYEDRVARISWSLDAKARTLRAEVDLKNSKDELRAGMYAYITFIAELPWAFTLPEKAVLREGEQHYCFRLVNGKAIRTPITVGVHEGGLVQVFKKQTQAPKKAGDLGTWEDFTADDEVIVTNPQSLADGQAVTVEQKS
jgi:RND family efflux transporter MFP subunit